MSFEITVPKQSVSGSNGGVCLLRSYQKMKIKINTVGGAWIKSFDILRNYPALKKYGFKYEKNDTSYGYINIRTMEDLCKLIDQIDQAIILDGPEDERELTIYDDYIE